MNTYNEKTQSSFQIIKSKQKSTSARHAMIFKDFIPMLSLITRRRNIYIFESDNTHLKVCILSSAATERQGNGLLNPRKPVRK